jgi:L-histidine N-alpha-methyltransferase
LAFVRQQLSQFALDVAEGLAEPQKRIPPRYFYDDLGSALFEAVTLLPEYGLTRADERLLQQHACEVAGVVGRVSLVAELGSGSGKKIGHVLRALSQSDKLQYRPIDVSAAALDLCAKELGVLAEVTPVCCDWMAGVEQVARERVGEEPLLILFVGSSIGNLDRQAMVDFLEVLRSYLRPGDYFLLGADLVKDVETMIAAYDDPTGVTAAFNLNILGRMNRELDADFDLRSFAHEARWNERERRIEMHLLSCRNQSVRIGLLDQCIEFEAGETIWTESSHKFTRRELDELAGRSRFIPVTTWVDREWPFAETLWRAE